MPYCVHCGVELSDYNKECPLCKTEVLYTGENKPSHNTDYPDYRINPTRELKRVNKLFTGKLLSMLFFNYAIITLVINIIINKTISWSIIPVISLALVWFGVAFPFLRKKNSFFGLFTLDCAAVTAYLFLLNIIISETITWSIYTGLSIGFLWIILSGFFATVKIKKVMPISVYYIITLIIFFITITLTINNRMSILQILLPITVLLLVLSLISYFVIMARANDMLGMMTVILFDVSVFCLALDMIIAHYYHGAWTPTWSIIVNVVTVPLLVTLHTIKKGRELRAIISKKLHR